MNQIVTDVGRRGQEHISWGDYNAFPAMRCSVLSHGRKSMLHLRHAWQQGIKDSEQMLWGRALHCLLFEREEFVTRYCAYDGPRNHKHTAYQEFLEANPDKEVMLLYGQYSWTSVLSAAQAVCANQLVNQYTREGIAELSGFVVEDGMQCKFRIDWVSTAAETLVDVKTARTISARPFGQQFFSLAYDIKLGLYQRWYRSITGRHWPVCVLAIENSPPHDSAVVPVPQAVLDDGAAKGLEILSRVKECIASDRWPGIANDELYPLEVPNYVMEEVEYE